MPHETAPASVLVVDDDEIMRVSLVDRLRMEGFETFATSDLASARKLLRKQDIDLVITDIRLPDGDGRALFEEVCRSAPGTPVILMTAYISVADAVALTKAGAVDYLTKPFDLDEFVAKVRRAIERLHDLRTAPLVAPDGSAATVGAGILGRSVALRRIEKIAARIHQVDSPILLTGESGVGKKIVARFIHRNSSRGAGPFVAVNCAALAPGVMESELFGYEKGAFPGADRRRIGRFEQAQGGTIFLDEVGEIPLASQVRLLRVLQEREVVRLGGAQPVALDVRVISATQVDLENAVAAGEFRSDLFWRLNVIQIPIPPLRKRPEDILFLARRFVAEQARQIGRPITGIAAAAEERLLHMEFPGNVRELRNMIERAVALAAGPRIQDYDLLFNDAADDDPVPDEATLDLKTQVEDAERAAILRALDETDGALQSAAALLGVSRKTLWEKMRRYDIDRHE
ncbi:MAG: sigma-54 dependent transcriptional regulator [Pseudorhodobacter sp.]|nr:sigma-54 dependent transcriptional regulator [Pseudorhodobacter sp.]